MDQSKYLENKSIKYKLNACKTQATPCEVVDYDQLRVTRSKSKMWQKISWPIKIARDNFIAPLRDRKKFQGLPPAGAEPPSKHPKKVDDPLPLCQG